MGDVHNRYNLHQVYTPRGRYRAFSGLSFDEYGLHPPNIFSEVLSKNLADHLGYAIFAGTVAHSSHVEKL